MRSRDGAGFLDRVGQDAKFAWRQILRHPVATVVATSILALGVGASTAVFSIVDGVVMRPLPFPESERLVRVTEVDTERGTTFGLAPPAYLLFSGNELRSLEGLAVLTEDGLDLEGRGEPEHLPVVHVSHDFFDVMGVEPRLGRAFTADEDRVGAPPVVVLSDGLWTRRFGADPGALGRPVRLGGELRTVIGVMPPDFDFPADAEAWLPVRNHLSGMEDVWGALFLDAVGRLRPGQEVAGAARELTALLEAVAGEETAGGEGAGARGYGASAAPLHDELTAGVRRPLLILLGAVILVLLVACANVGSLLLARAMGRRRELAVRTALGASRKRLTTTLLGESLMLAVLAGALGAALAYMALDGFLMLAPDDLPRASEIGVDGRALLFALGATLLTAVAVGLTPVLRLRADVVPALKEGQGGHTEGATGSRTRSALVVTQVAVTVVLLTGSALLAGSFLRLMQQETGFDPAGMVAVDLSLPGHRYEGEEDLLAFYREVLDQVERVPGVGVEGATLSRNLPMGGRNLGAPVKRPGADLVGRTVHVSATPGYFELMGTRMVRGRSFTRADLEEGRRPAVLSETLARSLFGGEDPLGEPVVTMFGMDTMEVVGVAEDVRFASLSADPGPVLYRPLSHWTSRGVHLVVRSALPPPVLFPALREAVGAVRADQPVKEMVTMQTLLARTTARPRFYALLLTAFAAVALALSALGVYGLLLSDVTRQRREIGIRLALGAGAGHVARRVVGRGLVLTATGVLLGVVAALFSGRLVEGLLFGVPARDPRTLAGVALALVMVSFAATVPAVVRATRVDPVRELGS